MTDAEPLDGLAALRRQVVDLLTQIDTGELPAPDRIRSKHDRLPGAEWQPLDRDWRIFTVDTEDGRDAVYLDWTHDGPWGQPGDWEALRPGAARRLAMALLAAADWAEQHRAEVPRLDRQRAKRTSRDQLASKE
jgi:hypothetical protein